MNTFGQSSSSGSRQAFGDYDRLHFVRLPAVFPEYGRLKTIGSYLSTGNLGASSGQIVSMGLYSGTSLASDAVRAKLAQTGELTVPNGTLTRYDLAVDKEVLLVPNAVYWICFNIKLVNSYTANVAGRTGGGNNTGQSYIATTHGYVYNATLPSTAPQGTTTSNTSIPGTYFLQYDPLTTSEVTSSFFGVIGK